MLEFERCFAKKRILENNSIDVLFVGKLNLAEDFSRKIFLKNVNAGNDNIGKILYWIKKFGNIYISII